ncbi:MAG: chorismate mutase [Chloroflexi bacterium]|nr:chorismate mutase [Chloroflexota bacterium]MDQ3401718.1 chorismate mutase [Chloroflexota bacterium]
MRGATVVDERGVEAATLELLSAVVARNGCALEDLAAAIFTVPDDLPDANPAAAARAHGWDLVPLLLVQEHGGATAIARCLRVLVLWNTTRTQAEIRHTYLGPAAGLRPDLAGGTS